ncbi:homeodomain transcription factor ste12 [Nowakowskiella sp. JEL0078]|nr:homeodomain transcription factor ste12 [Nowakowskiella sp. JEL0078]
MLYSVRLLSTLTLTIMFSNSPLTSFSSFDADMNLSPDLHNSGSIGSPKIISDKTSLDISLSTPESLKSDSYDSKTVEDLRNFLMTANKDWDTSSEMRRFKLPSGEFISCVYWKSRFFITGTDIVRGLVFRFESFGRPVKNMKKFEEGVFSDLRNLKPGVDATLEEPRSEFLELLYKFNCIRTQKKQKVFNWFSVPHDRLFLDALERDLKRESSGVDATSVAINPMPFAPTLEMAKKLCLPANSHEMSSPKAKKSRISSMDCTKEHTPESELTDSDSSYVSSDVSSPEFKLVELKKKLKRKQRQSSEKKSKVARTDERMFYCSYQSCNRQFKTPERLSEHVVEHIVQYSTPVADQNNSFYVESHLSSPDVNFHRVPERMSRTSSISSIGHPSTPMNHTALNHGALENIGFSLEPLPRMSDSPFIMSYLPCSVTSTSESSPYLFSHHQVLHEINMHDIPRTNDIITPMENPFLLDFDTVPSKSLDNLDTLPISSIHLDPVFMNEADTYMCIFPPTTVTTF